MSCKKNWSKLIKLKFTEKLVIWIKITLLKKRVVNNPLITLMRDKAELEELVDLGITRTGMKGWKI